MVCWKNKTSEFEQYLKQTWADLQKPVQVEQNTLSLLL